MTIKTLTLKAPAKINLYLKILSKRTDGYHELETLMQKISLYDELKLTLISEPGVRLRCQGADLPEDEGNIAVRAALLFLAQTGNRNQGVDITLQKNIPIAAGLGGGSSDAAAVLKGLDQLLGTECSTEQLAAMGLELGADVPLFTCDFPAAWATGIGEKLEPAAPLHGYTLLLVNPGIAVSTQWAYTAFSSTVDKRALTAIGKGSNLSCFSSSEGNFQPEALLNDLESVTAEKYSVIGELKKRLLAAGADGAMMSGSGATVFGLFPQSENKAELCWQMLKKEYDQIYLIDPLVSSRGMSCKKVEI